MREILFRGRTNYGEWFEGFYVHIPCGRGGIDEHLIQTIKEDGRIDRFIQVVPETVGQYTGLCDKNGKKIFEGDIVLVEGRTGTVVYSEENCVWYVGIEYGFEPPLNDYDRLYIKVIGNVHDNPELLEADNG